MSISRRAIVAAAQSVWLREHAMRWRFVRRASKRFLPGERAEDALAAAQELAAMGISAMPSRVGENITVAAEANAVAEHYVGVLAQMRAANLPGSLSIKPTQLGLDLDAELCYQNLIRILDATKFNSPSRASSFDSENKRTAPLQNSVGSAIGGGRVRTRPYKPTASTRALSGSTWNPALTPIERWNFFGACARRIQMLAFACKHICVERLLILNRCCLLAQRFVL